MKEKILLLLILCLELFAVLHWFDCRDFVGEFHYSQSSLDLRIIEGIHSDQQMPIWFVRIFHNKMMGFVFDVFAQYIQFWNVSFLASFLSLAGVAGLAAQAYAFFVAKKRHVVIWVLFLALLAFPLIEIFLFNHFSFVVRLLIIAFPFVAWSMLGYHYLLEKVHVNSKIIDGLILVSLWYLFTFHPIVTYCILK